MGRSCSLNPNQTLDQDVPLSYAESGLIHTLSGFGLAAQVSHLTFGSLLMPLRLPVLSCLAKDVVRDGVPGVVNADEKQQQSGSADSEHGLARMEEAP